MDCLGSGSEVHSGRTDGDGLVECMWCRRWATTTEIPHDTVMRLVDPHPARDWDPQEVQL
jgi:hypothetical protein